MVPEHHKLPSSAVYIVCVRQHSTAVHSALLLILQRFCPSVRLSHADVAIKLIIKQSTYFDRLKVCSDWMRCGARAHGAASTRKRTAPCRNATHRFRWEWTFSNFAFPTQKDLLGVTNELRRRFEIWAECENICWTMQFIMAQGYPVARQKAVT